MGAGGGGGNKEGKGKFQRNNKKRVICKQDPTLTNDLPDLTI